MTMQHALASRPAEKDPLDVPFDSAAYRRCLGQFPTGVAVVTAHVDGRAIGMTSNSFASVSLDPPLVLWSIKRSSQSFPAFMAATHFVVNVLAADQIDLSQKFAKSGPDKFDGVAWRGGVGSSPVLDGALAVFECSRERDEDGGDHVIMIGRVARFNRIAAREPLVFGQGRYAVLVDHGGPSQLPESARRLSPVRWPSPEHAPTHGDQEPLLSLVGRTWWFARDAVNEARRKDGVTELEVRMLRGIRAWPGLRLEELLPRLLVGGSMAEAQLGLLMDSRLVVMDGEARLRLTAAGEDRLAMIIRHAREVEEFALRGLSQQDLQTARRVLGQLASGAE